ncbi:MAG: S-layer homology domain-containing protein [Clostridia bacterium]|nr:S-layer homology domain-containing protein [Clostridia bacterium]
MKKYICLILAICALFTCGAYAEEEAPETPKAYFDDVAPTAWYAEAVNYCYEDGIVRGMTATSFKPETPITRGMFVTILGRFSGVEDDMTVSTVFTDVPAGKYYSAHVKWAFEAGVVNGMSPTTFAPDKDISRQDMCVMIRRYCNYMGIELTEIVETPVFTDEADIASYAKESITNMLRAGLVNGMGSKFNPKGTSTRAQAATIMMRLDDLAKSQEGAMRLLDQKTGLVIEYTVDSGITANTILDVTMTEGYIPNELSGDRTYTIRFIENDEYVSPKVPVKVKIPVEDGAFALERIVYTMTADKIMLHQDFTIENGYYTFEFMCNTDIFTGVYCWTKNY